ncbi:MAG TPA: hypothetical protein VIL78_18205 [Hanamia sp.]
MKNSLTPKEALLSALFAVLLIPFAVLLNIAIEWFINNVVLWVFDWFNGIGVFYKIFVLIIGGLSIFFLFLSIFKSIGGLLSYLVFDKLPENLFTIIFSSIVYLINVVLTIISLWKIVQHFDFWSVCEFVILSAFILSANTILIPWYRKEMAKLKAGY